MPSQSEREKWGANIQDCVDWVLIDPSSFIENKPPPITVAYATVQKVFQYVLRNDDDALESIESSALLDSRMVKESLQWILDHVDDSASTRERCFTVKDRLDLS